MRPLASRSDRIAAGSETTRLATLPDFAGRVLAFLARTRPTLSRIHNPKSDHISA